MTFKIFEPDLQKLTFSHVLFFGAGKVRQWAGGGGGPCTYIPDMKYEQVIPQMTNTQQTKEMSPSTIL